MDSSFVKSLVNKVRKAEEDVLSRVNDRQISEEEDITAQLAGKISELIEKGDNKLRRSEVYSKVFTRKGRESQESIIGADLGVLMEVK